MGHSVEILELMSVLAMFYAGLTLSQSDREMFRFHYKTKPDYTLLSTLPYPMMHCGGSTFEGVSEV
jgi:hypothetical protein